MIYDDSMFDLCINACTKYESQISNSNDVSVNKSTRCLKSILSKLKNALDAGDNIKDGILRIKFCRLFYDDYDDGYKDIDDMIKNDEFSTFAREYCIYLGSVRSECNEFGPAYYELIWDFKTYFDQFKNRSDAKALISSRKQQKRSAKRAICKVNGHDYGEWEEVSYTKKIEVGAAGIEGLICGSGVEEIIAKKWIRKCQCCGVVSTSLTKPDEVGLKELNEETQRLLKKVKNNFGK